MVAPDYHEEDGHSTASSSTQLPSQHPLRQRFGERLGGGTDLSTVPPTPLNHRHHLLSPVRTETPSHSYNLRSTPDRIAAMDREGSQGDGLGRALGGRDGGGRDGGVAGVDVTGSGGGRGDARRGAAGTSAARVVGGDSGRNAAGLSGGRLVSARVGRGVVGRAVVGGGGRGGRTRQSTGAAAGGTARGGVKNYSAAEVDSLLQTIRAICPIGNDHWEVVAELHSNRYAVCGRTAESIRRKFASLASTQPSSGNPTMPPAVALAKEIREAISHRAGITDADLSDVLDLEEEEEEEEGVHNNLPPQEITVSTNPPAAIITQPEQPEALNNQQQLGTAATTRERRASAASSGHLSTLASVSVAQNRARTRQNVISSAIDNVTSANNSAISAFLQQKQIEWEEARARREEELFELRRKELRQEEQRNRLEEQRNMMFQLAMTGMMAYFGMKKDTDDDDKKRPGNN